MYIPDYNDLYDRYEREQYRELRKLPKCCACDEHIVSEDCYEINGKLICPDCLVDIYRKRTEDYVD